MSAGTRRFIDAPDDARCVATIALRDGSKARCGRRAMAETRYCWQHSDRTQWKRTAFDGSCEVVKTTGAGCRRTAKVRVFIARGKKINACAEHATAMLNAGKARYTTPLSAAVPSTEARDA